jgi:hypothetical protein
MWWCHVSIGVSAGSEEEAMTVRLLRTLLSVVFSFGLASVVLAQELAPAKCLPASPESESWVANAKPMSTGTWSGIWCGTTREGVDPESVYPATQASLVLLPDGRVTLLLLTGDGQLLRLQVSECAGDLSLTQGPDAASLNNATRQIRLTVTVGKSKIDPKRNELMEAKDSTGRVVYRLGQCV